MVRLFERHTVRKERELGGSWEMYKLSNNGEALERFYSVVPSCWESMRGFEDFRQRYGNGRSIHQLYGGGITV